ncbi:hypothetical protein [Azospirillum doebereinerae]|uniref:hypothetical protein n=1 Tax=Azospirillum doebereinerae TaxID=92933 RepID=UPI001B3C0CCA|nr:hypothetical protein [Azospirillum doebereinerae]
MDDAAHMPQLGDDPAAGLVHLVCHPAPTHDLFGGPDAGGVGPAEALLEMPIASLTMRPAEARWP